MNPVHATEAHVAYWTEHDGCEQLPRVIGGPEEGPDVIPCPALVAPGAGVVHVAYELNELELATLAQGGTLWLTTWGGLPIHHLAVTTREATA